MKLIILIIALSSAGCIAETVDPADPPCDDDGDAGADADDAPEVCYTLPCLAGPIGCETDEDCGIGVCDPESKVCVEPE